MDLMIFLSGLLIGSFLNVCIYRIPRKESVIRPGSRCPVCRTRLSPQELVPVLSYIFLRGRCRYCNQPIPWRYPAVELLTALLICMAYKHYGTGFAAIYYTLLICILIAAAAIDIEHMIIPDGLLLTGCSAALLFNILGVGISFADGMLGFILGGGMLALIAVASFFIFDKEGLGGGDIKLAATIGLYLGWRLTALTLVLSVYAGGLTGLLLMILKIKKRGEYIAYGPFLAVGSLIAMFYGEAIINWYLSSFWY